MTKSKRALVALFGFTIASSLFATPSARADDKAVCSQAYQQAQVLKDDHKLLDARKQLRVCGRSECAAFIVKDCTDWLAQVEAALPSVVFTMKDAQGADVIDATVTMDGAVLATKLDGRSISVDPGPHRFQIETKDGQKIVQSLLVREGVKEQQVTFGQSTAPTNPTNPTKPPDTTPQQNPDGSQTPPPQPPPDKPSGGSTFKTVGYIVGGVGVVGLGLGSVFGIIAMSDNNSAQCDAQNFCKTPQSRTDAQGAATISTIGFIAGGALLAGGVVMILIAPSGDKADKSKSAFAPIEVAPLVGAGSGGISLRGAW